MSAASKPGEAISEVRRGRHVGLALNVIEC
jgi:hypothetical protein